jgi:exosortase A
MASASLVNSMTPLRQTRAHAGALVACAVALAVVLVFFDTARSMADVWRRSATFSHGFLVVPIALWLAWRRRAALAAAPPRPWWPALGLLAAAGFGWLLGHLGDAAVVQHFALVLMVQAAVLAACGPRFVRALAFPLAFLLFAVPFGEAFVPVLMDWTADFTVFALKLTGIPVYREGNFFVVPSGQWSVVEACSGIRYLIASLMVGTLYAYLVYRTVWRRLLFFAAAIAVPIVANWLRAYLIVLVGHLSGNELAVGVDHLIYGWFFFGIVMALMFWVGARFRESPVDAPRPAAAPTMQHQAPPPHTVAAAALAAVLIAGGYVALAARLMQPPQAGTLARIEPAPGWSDVDAGPHWQPRFAGSTARLQQAFERDGRRVFVHVAWYDGRRREPGLVSSANVLVAEGDARWRLLGRGRTAVASGAATIPVRTAQVGGADGRFDVLWWYWIDGEVAAADAWAKAYVVASRLRGGPGAGAAVFVFGEPEEGTAGGDARLRRAAGEFAPRIAQALAAASGGAR